MKKALIAWFLTLVFIVTACGACASETEPPVFATFGDAVRAAGEEPVMGGGSDYMAVIIENNGQYFRLVTEFDDHAMELGEAISQAEDISAAFDAFYDYVYTLPISYGEMFTAKPIEQAELDALNGKTVAELEQEGYLYMSSSTGAEDDPVLFQMAYDLYEYQFTADADTALYEEKSENDTLDTLTLRDGRLTGPSRMAAELRYHADGTVEPEEEPFAGLDWLEKLTEAIEAAQNGEAVDLEGVLSSLAEEYPEAADMIHQILEMYPAAAE